MNLYLAIVAVNLIPGEAIHHTVGVFSTLEAAQKCAQAAVAILSDRPTTVDGQRILFEHALPGETIPAWVEEKQVDSVGGLNDLAVMKKSYDRVKLLR